MKSVRAARVTTTDAEIDAAIRQARAYERRGGAKIVAARYIPGHDVIDLRLSTGARIELPRKAFPRLRAVAAKELSHAIVGPAGASVWFETADTGMDLEEII